MRARSQVSPNTREWLTLEYLGSTARARRWVWLGARLTVPKGQPTLAEAAQRGASLGLTPRFSFYAAWAARHAGVSLLLASSLLFAACLTHGFFLSLGSGLLCGVALLGASVGLFVGCSRSVALIGVLCLASLLALFRVAAFRPSAVQSAPAPQPAFGLGALNFPSTVASQARRNNLLSAYTLVVDAWALTPALTKLLPACGPAQALFLVLPQTALTAQSLRSHALATRPADLLAPALGVFLRQQPVLCGLQAFAWQQAHSHNAAVARLRWSWQQAGDALALDTAAGGLLRRLASDATAYSPAPGTAAHLQPLRTLRPVFDLPRLTLRPLRYGEAQVLPVNASRWARSPALRPLRHWR